MRIFRTSLRLVAIIAVLLHGAMIVRHNAAMLGASLTAAFDAALQDAICHGGVSNSDESARVPGERSPEGDALGCPICKGMATAVAILADPLLLPHRPDVASARMAVVGEVIALRLTPVRPPTRGPPLHG